MHIETQKSIAIYLSYFLTFCVGLDNGVILPTILEYLRILQIPHEAILGVAIAGYGLTSCISARLMRHLAESCILINIRVLLIICCTCFVTGGFIYSYGTSWWGVVFGRLFCGFGSGALFVIDTDISSSSLAPELSHLQKHLKLSVAIGWISSPLFSMILTSVNSNPEATPFGAVPQLLCATVFTICGVFTLIGWFDVGKTLRYCRLRQNLSLAYERVSFSGKSYGTVKSPSTEYESEEGYARICGLWSARTSTQSSPASSHRQSLDIEHKIQHFEATKNSSLTKSDEILEKAEGFMGKRELSMKTTEKILHYNSDNSTSGGFGTPGDGLVSELDYITPRFRACNKRGFCFHFQNSSGMGAPFLTGFLFGSLQTMLTPLTDSYFSFGSTENGVMQLVLAVIGVLPPLIFCHCNLPKRVLYIAGCIIAAVSSGWLLMISPAFNLGLGSLPAFSAGLLGASFACGLLFVACPDHSDLNCSVLVPQPWASWICGLIIGPLWAGATVSTPRLLLGGQLTLILIVAGTNFFKNSQ